MLIEPPMQYVFTNQEMAALKVKKKKVRHDGPHHIHCRYAESNHRDLFDGKRRILHVQSAHRWITPMIRPTELESGQLKY